MPLPTATAPDETPSTSQTPPIVRLIGVHKSFGRHDVLRGITLGFPTGKTTVVLGPSGCGKSVMLKHVIGLLQPDQGEVWFEDTRVDTLRESQLVEIRRQFGFLFQHGALFDSHSVGENVAFPLAEHTTMGRKERLDRAAEVLGLVGLRDHISKMPADLSGGQQKRAALARAIVLNPRVILYDEPTTGLDPIRADVINELIIRLRDELDATSIVVTHDLTSAFKVAQRMVMLHEGSVIKEGSPESFKESPNPVVQRFLRGEATADELGDLQTLISIPDSADNGGQAPGADT